jgi:predicted NAD/FAD-dependent oxidoreductase
MKLRLSDGQTIALRAIAAAGFIGAFLFALLLSVAPQLHERIHQPNGATHECAVTLLTTGSCEHTPFDAIAIAPPAPRPASALVHRHFPLASGRLEFSLLEHAPPAIS